MEVVSRIVRRDKEVQDLVVRPIAATRERVENVAERLRTGRLAEDYFLHNSAQICGFPSADLIDYRIEARGFDFGVRRDERLAIEVKGLKLLRGQILFTDFEWQQANRRKGDYWLVVVGSVVSEPRALLVKDPASSVTVVSSLHQNTVVSWKANISVA